MNTHAEQALKFVLKWGKALENIVNDFPAAALGAKRRGKAPNGGGLVELTSCPSWNRTYDSSTVKPYRLMLFLSMPQHLGSSFLRGKAAAFSSVFMKFWPSLVRRLCVCEA